MWNILAVGDTVRPDLSNADTLPNDFSNFNCMGHFACKQITCEHKNLDLFPNQYNSTDACNGNFEGMLRNSHIHIVQAEKYIKTLTIVQI